MRLSHFFILLTLPFPTMAANGNAAEDAVMVIGALHELHTSEPAFGYDRLQNAIVTFAPDILLLEVRPDELAERKQTPGRPEYPAVIWPLLAKIQVTAMAMEPGGETFKAITGEAGTAFDAFRKSNPEGAAALSRLNQAAEEALLSHWQSAAQTQDMTTESLTNGVQAAQFALAGPRFVKAQSEWDGYMADRVHDAVRANPGKRVMVIGSYKNRAMLDRTAREIAPGRVIGAAAWFEQASPATPTSDSKTD